MKGNFSHVVAFFLGVVVILLMANLPHYKISGIQETTIQDNITSIPAHEYRECKVWKYSSYCCSQVGTCSGGSWLSTEPRPQFPTQASEECPTGGGSSECIEWKEEKKP